MADELADLQNQQNEQVINQTPSGPDKPVIGQDTGKKTSLRDELKKQFKAAAEPVRPTKEAKEPEKSTKPAEERPRDETGKFVAAEKPTESPKTEAEAQPEASEAIRPPPGWSAESKAAFNSLPDHLKGDVIKREKEIADGFKSKDEKLNRYQEIEQVLSSARPIYQKNGVQSDAEAIKRLFAWESYIRSNPQQAIQEIARQYGVTLAPDSPTSQAQDDIPQWARAILDRSETESQRLARLEAENAQQQQAAIAQDLTSFSKDKPYFERVRVQMGQLMQAGLATDLQGAYQKAIALNPEIQAEIKSDEEAKKLIEQQKHNQERVQKAAQAAVSPSTRAPSAALSSTQKQPGIRGSILQAIQEVRGNGRA